MLQKLKKIQFLKNTDLFNIRSLPGVIFIFSITLYPYVYIISRAAFSEISYSYNEIGKTLGLKQLKIFFDNIYLPMTALFEGASLVFGFSITSEILKFNLSKFLDTE